MQLLLTWKRKKFPDSPYKRFKKWRSSKLSRSINRRDDTTRRPLLSDSFNSSTTSGIEHEERCKLLAFDSIQASNYATITGDVIK